MGWGHVALAAPCHMRGLGPLHDRRLSLCHRILWRQLLGRRVRRAARLQLRLCLPAWHQGCQWRLVRCLHLGSQLLRLPAPHSQVGLTKRPRFCISRPSVRQCRARGRHHSLQAARQAAPPVRRQQVQRAVGCEVLPAERRQVWAPTSMPMAVHGRNIPAAPGCLPKVQMWPQQPSPSGRSAPIRLVAQPGQRQAASPRSLERVPHAVRRHRFNAGVAIGQVSLIHD